ncbi:MAG: hypothetical protein PF503_16630 [Desulfobacula sp.]|jgi:hypothetical protein|nr:hypothetical protein [Desulfobacula sp.]
MPKVLKSQIFVILLAISLLFLQAVPAQKEEMLGSQGSIEKAHAAMESHPEMDSKKKSVDAHDSDGLAKIIMAAQTEEAKLSQQIQNTPLCKATCPPLGIAVYLKTSLNKGTCVNIMAVQTQVDL